MTGDTVSTPRKGLQLGALLRAALALFVATISGRTALYLASWQPPIKYVGLVALIVALGLVIYSVKWTWQWIRTVSPVRVLVIVLLCYFLMVGITGLRPWGQAGSFDDWLHIAISVPLDIGRAVSRGALALLEFPGRFVKEFSGSFVAETVGAGIVSSEPPVPANASIPPIQIEIIPAKANTKVFSLGDAASTTDKAVHLCQMDVFADGTFTAGTRVRVVEGPRYITDEQWWRVRSDGNSGWCPSSALLP